MGRSTVLLALIAIILSGCGDGDAVDDGGSRSGSAVASPNASVTPNTPVEATATASVTPSLAPSSTATPTPGAEIWCCATTIGTITEAHISNGVGTLLVVEHPDNPTSGEQHVVSLDADTQVHAWTANGAESRTLDALTVGQHVLVSFAGGVEESYPAQGSAHDVSILRTETDGPANPDDLVTLTIRMSLFNVYGESPPPDDDFYVEYVTGEGDAERQFFCGDDERAPEICRGSGGTYEIQIVVPRGTALTSTIYRVIGPEPETVEPGESFDAVVDTDLITSSHYRYSASDPWGFQ